MKYKMEEIATIKYGKNQKKVLSEKGTIPIYGTGGLMAYATEPLYNKPSVLIGRKGTIDKVRFVTQPFWTVDTLFYTIINESLVRPCYFYYLMCQVDLLKLNEGTTIPSLRTETLNRLCFEIPSLAIQDKVISMIEPIEKKIMSNNMINNNLEEQAFAIFRSWFVDFEPSGGTIPANWNMSTLSNVSEIGAGGDKPPNVSEQFSEDCPYPIYSNGISNEGLYGYTDNAKIFDESISVSARGTIGFVCLRHIPYVPIVRLITLIPDKQKITAKYLYCWLKSIHIAGTGTTQQQLTVPQFKSTEILIPDANAMTRFTDITDSLFNKIWSNQDENMRLASLRDTLLPRLISGELDVSDIDI